VSSAALRLVPPLPDDPYMWKQLMNLCYGAGEDELFVWLRSVREAVEDAEQNEGDASGRVDLPAKKFSSGLTSISARGEV
jgi:hypothetical protein